VVREVGTVERDTAHGDVYVIRDYLLAVADAAPLRAGDDASDAGYFAMDQFHDLEITPGLLEFLAEHGILDS